MSKNNSAASFGFLVSSISRPDLSAQVKINDLYEAVGQWSGSPIKAPRLSFKTDDFSSGIISNKTTKIPLAWTVHQYELSPERTYPDMIFDDQIGAGLRFRPNEEGEPSLEWFAKELLPRICASFDAYRAEVEGLPNESKVLNSTLDYRNKITMEAFPYVAFYDDRICRRSFGVDAAGIAARLRGKVPYAESLALKGRAGVIVQVARDYVGPDALRKITKSIYRLMSGER